MGYYPYYEFDYSYGMEELGSFAGIFLGAMAVIYLLMIGFAILVYILQALGTYTIAMRRGINHPWLAWVPFGNTWILGSISDQYQYVAQGKVRNRRKILVGLQIAMMVLCLATIGVAIVGMVQSMMHGINAMGAGFAVALAVIYVALLVISILLSVFQYICLYNLFASCDPNNKVTFLLLSIFVGVTLPFLVFVCRKKDYGMPPRRTEPAPCVPIDPPAFEEQ